MKATTPTKKQGSLSPPGRCYVHFRFIVSTASTEYGANLRGIQGVVSAVTVLTEPLADTATSAMLCDTDPAKTRTRPLNL